MEEERSKRIRVADRRNFLVEDTIIQEEEKDNTIDEKEDNKTSLNNDENEKHEKKHNGGEEEEEEEARPWGVLNRDNLELISSYLHPVDYIGFRAVCKTIRSIIPEVYRRTVIKNRNLSPWLVFSKNNGTTGSFNFVDPMRNNQKYLITNLSGLLVGAQIYFSNHGWLLMSNLDCVTTQTLFFYNPFTSAMIQLPDLPNGFFSHCMAFSSLPTSSDCVVFGLAGWNLFTTSIIDIRRGEHFWRYRFLENDDLLYRPFTNNSAFCDGALYCLDCDETLGVFNLKDGLEYKALVNPPIKGLRLHFSVDYTSFLVKCDGELLLVELGYLGETVKIFKLDFSKMVWVRVGRLGKYMLFISDTTCLSATAPNISMENKIYFSRLHGERILFYSLDTRRYHSIGSRHSAKNFCNTTECLDCTWIEPNWSPSTEQELDWLSIY